MNVKTDVEQQVNAQVLRLIPGFTFTLEDDNAVDLVRLEAKTVFLTWRQVRLKMGEVHVWQAQRMGQIHRMIG